MNRNKLIYSLDLTLQILFLLWAIIIPWSTAGMQIFLGLLIATLIGISILNHNSPIKYHPFYIIILVYLLSNLVSALNSSDWLASLNASFANDWTILAIPFLISLPIKPIWRKRAFVGLMFSACLVGVIGIIQSLTGNDFVKGHVLVSQGNFYRAIGTYSSYLTFGGNQLFAFAVGIAFFISLRKWSIDKYKYLFFSVVIFLSMVATFTRSAWIAAIIVIFLGTFIILDKKKFLIVFGGLFIIGIILLNVIPDLHARFLSSFSQSQNEGRITLWATSWEIIKDNFLLGIGNGNFPKYFLIYKVPGFYDAFSHAHNDFINVTVINGITGLITWVAVWVAWFYYAIKGYINIEEIEADKQIMLSAILGITGILVAAQFQCFYTDLENNIFWWFIASTALQIGIQNKKKYLQI